MDILNARDARQTIAHEIGHFIVRSHALPVADEEDFCDRFDGTIVGRADSDIKMPDVTPKLFLGIDGGQSHTEAVVADDAGNVRGRGVGGPSNHAEQPGGRERLRAAITDSVAAALRQAGIGLEIPLHDFEFFGAHCGMTGGADYKEEIISATLRATTLTVGHDAPAALAGALADRPGVIVIAGTGSVVYGENASGESVKLGGLGYLFSDEGSGFWLATQAIRLAIKEQDGLIKDAGILGLVLDHFAVPDIRSLTTPFYNGMIDRDAIAAFARTAAAAAGNGNALLKGEIRSGAGILAESAVMAASRLGFGAEFLVSGVGGMFRGLLMWQFFAEALHELNAHAEFVPPRFDPAIGALLLAYRNSGLAVDEEMLGRLGRIV